MPPDIARLTACVDSSSSDMLAGLAKWPVFSVPPDCWATAPGAKHRPTSSDPAAVRTPERHVISIHLPGSLRHRCVAMPRLWCAAAHPEGRARRRGLTELRQRMDARRQPRLAMRQGETSGSLRAP